MCGFFGQFSTASPDLTPEKKARLSALLAHRGPDDFGFVSGSSFCAMFWRLSIVDQVNGKQPMISADGKKTVLFNGEIYNFRLLRSQLEAEGARLRTDSDTEVILAAFERWGSGCFARFEGMFAICLVDETARRIYLVRDRLGVKPLYYRLGKGRLTVASEQKAILAVTGEPARLDRGAFREYLVFQTVISEDTLFEGIKKAPAGHVLVFDLDGLNLKARERIERPEPALCHSYADFRRQIEERVREQAGLALATDLPICFHLSGGFDSNTLIALCRSLDPEREFTCISSLVGAEQDPEWEFIRRSAEFHRSRLKTVEVSEESFFGILDDVLYYLDEPVGDPGVVAQFLVNRLAREESKIVFSGQGFDEMFFGYMRNLAAFVLGERGPQALITGTREFQALPETSRQFFTGWEGFLASMAADASAGTELAYFKKLCRFDPFSRRADSLGEDFRAPLHALSEDLFRKLRSSSDTLQQFMFAAETKVQLPALLHMEDRASMRYSLETRVPFCTAAIIDAASRADIRWIVRDGCPKGVLRDIFNPILPGHIVFRRQKVGRPIPLRRWLEKRREGWNLEKIQKKSELFRELTGADFVSYALNSSNPWDRSLWAVISVSQWLDLYQVSV